MPHTPEWLRQFANEVANQIDSVEDITPLGCHFAEVGGEWEVTLFKGYLEVVGGPHDGTRHISCFTLNIGQLTNLFDEVTDCWWQTQSLGSADELGPHVAVAGRYRGHRIWLRIMSHPPKRFQTGLVTRAHQFAKPDPV